MQDLLADKCVVAHRHFQVDFMHVRRKWRHYGARSGRRAVAHNPLVRGAGDGAGSRRLSRLALFAVLVAGNSRARCANRLVGLGSGKHDGTARSTSAEISAGSVGPIEDTRMLASRVVLTSIRLRIAVLVMFWSEKPNSETALASGNRMATSVNLSISLNFSASPASATSASLISRYVIPRRFERNTRLNVAHWSRNLAGSMSQSDLSMLWSKVRDLKLNVGFAVVWRKRAFRQVTGVVA